MILLLIRIMFHDSGKRRMALCVKFNRRVTKHVLIFRLKASPAVKGEILYGIHSALLALLADRREFHKFYIRDSLVESEKPALQQLMSLVREKKVNFEACNKSLLTSLSQARPHQVWTTCYRDIINNLYLFIHSFFEVKRSSLYRGVPINRPYHNWADY